jgi:hypothetical protein
MTSFWTSPNSETEISWRTSSCRTLISGSCSASWARAARNAPRSRGSRGTTTVSRVGGANWRRSGRRRGGAPIASPTWICASPHSFPICPADTDPRRTAGPPAKAPPAKAPPAKALTAKALTAKALTAVTFCTPPGPARTRSRIRTVPENMRT